MNKFRFFVLALVGLALANPSPSRAGVRKHALAKVVVAAVKAPKFSLTAIKDSVGSALFAVEAGVDIVHVGTSALNAAASKELKHHPFGMAAKVAAKADAGLESAYSFLFHVQI